MSTIKKASNTDIPWMVELSHSIRASYAKVYGNFWKMAKNSDKIQSEYFNELLAMKDVIALVSSDKKGFVIGRIIIPPKIYDAPLTLMIDDFCVVDKKSWLSTGNKMLNKIKMIAAKKRVGQILVVSGEHDKIKNNFLKSFGMYIASNWYVQDI